MSKTPGPFATPPSIPKGISESVPAGQTVSRCPRSSVPPLLLAEADAHRVAAPLARDARGRDARARQPLRDPERETGDPRGVVGRALADDEGLEVREEPFPPRREERREDAGAAHARNSVTPVVNRARTSARTVTPVPGPFGTGMSPPLASSAGSTTSSSK